MNYPERSGLPVELFCNFVDGKSHISSKHDHNKKNFSPKKRSDFLSYSKHYHSLPSVPQIKVIKTEASRRSHELGGRRECRSLGLEKDGLTSYEIRSERTKKKKKIANSWKRFMQQELSESSYFKLGQPALADLP